MALFGKPKYSTVQVKKKDIPKGLWTKCPKTNKIIYIKELEEKHRIELRKKAILKNQCDAAYLRGVSAISTEALKMSHSTLDDFYKGMKMPAYNGNNIHQQMA